MSSFLPQQDPDAEKRSQELADAQQAFRYNYDSRVSPLAIAAEVPKGYGFAFGWLIKMAGSVLHVLANHIENETDSQRKACHRNEKRRFIGELLLGRVKPGKVLRYVANSLNEAIAERPGSLDDYAELFRAIGLPPISKDFREDRVFAYQRTAGANPLMIERVKELPDNFKVTAEMYSQVITGDTLDAAIAEGRLYLADYGVLEGTPAGEAYGFQKSLYAPLSLYTVSKASGDLLPVAIQCEQTPGKDNPIFTPNDSYNWLIAKTIVEVADANIHEVVSHLGRTHLFVEPFVVTTHRQLASNHPLYKLLVPHFQGTLPINDQAVKTLIAPGEAVDRIMGPKIESVWGLAVKGVESFPFDENLLPKTFAHRGVNDTEALPVYPYRDDSMLYWEAIHEWVTSYLGLYYLSGADVAGDTEVQAWFKELGAKNGGRVKGLTGDFGSLNYLIDVVTMVIYTSSVQHAAVNFPQYDLMSYVPNMPGAVYLPRPTELSGATERDFLNTLPPTKVAEYQTEFLYVLGSVHYTCLGNYGWFHFKDARVRPALKKFQSRIKNIGDVIKLRNQHRRPYNFLAPKGVPQSINA